MSTGTLIPGFGRKPDHLPNPRAQDEEQLRIDGALAHIQERGNLDEFPADRNERRALIVTSVRRGLVAWDRRRERYELTGSGRAQLAGYAARAKIAEAPTHHEPEPVKQAPLPIKRPAAPAVRRSTRRPMAIAAAIMLAACSGVAAGALLESSRTSPSGSAEATTSARADTLPATTGSVAATKVATSDQAGREALGTPIPQPRPVPAPASVPASEAATAPAPAPAPIAVAPGTPGGEGTTAAPSRLPAPSHDAAAAEPASPVVDAVAAKASGGADTPHEAAMATETSPSIDAKRIDRHSRHDRYAHSHRSKVAGGDHGSDGQRDWFRRQARADRRYGDASTYDGRNGFAYNDEEDAPSYRAGRYRGYRDGPPVITMRRPPPVDVEGAGPREPNIFGWLYH
jgi:hypothetical protein